MRPRSRARRRCVVVAARARRVLPFVAQRLPPRRSARRSAIYFIADPRPEHPHRLHGPDLDRPRRVHGDRRLHDGDPVARPRHEPDRDAAAGLRDLLRLRRRSSASRRSRFSGVYLALATFALARLGAAAPAQVLELPGGSNGIQTSRRRSATSGSTASAWALRRDPLRARVAAPARPDRPGLPRRPRQRDRGRVVGRRAADLQDARLRRSRPRIAGVAGSLFVLATNGYAQPDVFGVVLSLQHPDRRRRGRARLALGRPRRRRVRRPPARRSRASVPVIGSDARPGRRLRR